jgi:hypothetical protein
MAGLKALFQAMTKGLKKIPEEIGTLPSEEELIKKGFDPSTFYHGSPRKNIMEFIPQASDRTAFAGYREARKGEPTTFFTESPSYAEGFSLKEGQPVYDKKGNYEYSLPTESSRIYPVKLKLEDVYDYNNPEHRKILEKNLGTTMEEGGEIGQSLKIGDPFILQQPQISKAIKDSGFNGYLTNETDRFGQRTVGLFEPGKGNVRSIFAKFDPTKSESGNIYASVGGGAFLGYGALEGIEDETND